MCANMAYPVWNLIGLARFQFVNKAASPSNMVKMCIGVIYTHIPTAVTARKVVLMCTQYATLSWSSPLPSYCIGLPLTQKITPTIN